MTLIGPTMMGEQVGPKQLVREVALAEQAGFDFAVISDRYFPKVPQHRARRMAVPAGLSLNPPISPMEPLVWPGKRPISAAEAVHLLGAPPSEYQGILTWEDAIERTESGWIQAQTPASVRGPPRRYEETSVCWLG